MKNFVNCYYLVASALSLMMSRIQLGILFRNVWQSHLLKLAQTDFKLSTSSFLTFEATSWSYFFIKTQIFSMLFKSGELLCQGRNFILFILGQDFVPFDVWHDA